MAPDQSMILVDHSAPDTRLDVFLCRLFPGTSRGTIQRLIKEGHILLDGKAAKATTNPKNGQEILVHWPEPKAAEALPENIPLDILHEDDSLLVVNKPAGLVVHPAAGHEGGTLVNALLHHCAGRLSGIGGVARPGIVHRLDMDTSGVMVVAKDDPTHISLSNQFQERTTTKLYDALVCGAMLKSEGDIRADIARHPNHRKRMAVTDKGGREAWTSYIVSENFNHSAHVEATLHTGRTHQIRVHFQFIGHPLVGDNVYGAKPNKRLTELTAFTAPRQMLHARELSFDHPASGKRMRFKAPLPADFKKCLQHLRRC